VEGRARSNVHYVIPHLITEPALFESTFRAVIATVVYATALVAAVHGFRATFRWARRRWRRDG